MARLYFRYGNGKSSDLCQTAYNYTEKGMRILTMNADKNKTIQAKVKVDDRYIFSWDVNYHLNKKKSLYADVYNMDRTNLACILVDNAHLLTRAQADDLFFISKMLDITVITYGNRMEGKQEFEGSLRLMELANSIELIDEIEMVYRPKFQYYYGAMNCGKSSRLIYSNYKFKESGYKVFVIKPKVDRDPEMIWTRPGLKLKADLVVDKDDSIYCEGQYLEKNHYNLVLVDEAQFLTTKQIDELKRINRDFNMAIRCYSIKTDFKSNAFTGSKRLLQTCDEIKKMRTICSCGEGAEFNVRKTSRGKYITEGDVECIDDGKSIIYESICDKCFIKKILKIRSADQLLPKPKKTTKTN